MNEELRIDESRGDVYDHIADDETGATGYPDRVYLRHLNKLAHSQEVPVTVRASAQKALGSIATNYGLEKYATIIKRAHDDSTNL